MPALFALDHARIVAEHAADIRRRYFLRAAGRCAPSDALRLFERLEERAIFCLMTLLATGEALALWGELL